MSDSSDDKVLDKAEEKVEEPKVETPVEPEEAKPWEETPEEEVEVEAEEEIDIDEALAKAKAAYEAQGVRGKDPNQERIDALEAEIQALKQGGDKPKVKLSENATIDELMSVVDQLVEEKIKQRFQFTETQKQREEQQKRMMIAQQDQTIDMQLKILRDNKVTSNPAEDKEILQTCIDYGLTDIFKGAKIWDKERKLKAVNEKAKSSNTVIQKKDMMAKLGKGNPIISSRPKMDVRRMTMDDIAAAAARR